MWRNNTMRNKYLRNFQSRQTVGMDFLIKLWCLCRDIDLADSYIYRNLHYTDTQRESGCCSTYSACYRERGCRLYLCPSAAHQAPVSYFTAAHHYHPILLPLQQETTPRDETLFRENVTLLVYSLIAVFIF